MAVAFADALRAGRPRLRRTRAVARILLGHGLESIADQLGLRRFALPFRRRARVAPHLTQAQRLRMALGEMGVTFIKLGQMLSTRADLLPADFIAELSKLQDSAPSVPFEIIERTLLEDLGDKSLPPFRAFERIPIASASIGQVHAAMLSDGTPVVVKVRRPSVVEDVELDLAILHDIVEWVQTRTPIGEDYDLRPLVEEFAYTLRNELDYLREAQNATRLRRAFDGDTGVWIPRVFDEYTTSRVLTMERVGGIKISDVATLDRLGVSRRAIAENAVRIFLRQVLDFGFFHADPHPGNFFVQPDASLAIVDFGMVGRVSEATHQHLLRAVVAAGREDSEELAEELYALGVAGRRADRAAFEKDLEHLIGRFEGRSMRELSAASVTEELTRVAFRHRLQLPSELALLLRVLNMSEGLGLTLDPEFRYLEYASPIFRRNWRQRHSPGTLAKRVGRATLDAAELGVDMPRRAARLLGRLERGEMQLNMQHRGLEGLTREFQRMTNRLALSVILGASIIALAMAAGIRQVPELASIIGWLFRLGLLFSLAFGASVLWEIWRAGRR